ncbi:hypothetical protein JD516_09450 [Aeromonas jandaei]|uniref:substrate-binding periplasmic protein n=1 Tax=Aeromonas jandaei TaxID=650 RepID=UPI00191F9641|nr:hypothetical protein [Aeromonas jandaei]MBL0598038.1 hypothetical protein [Aeromonas jandaei]
MAQQYIKVILYFCLYISFTCRAESLNVYCDNWPRFCQTDGKGFYLDLVRTIYQPHGYIITPHIVPYKRALSSVVNKKGDIALGVYQHEIEKVLFPEYADSADDLTVMMLNQWQSRWHGEPTLEGQHVLWPSGWALEKYLSVSVNAHEVDSVETAIKLLRKKRYRYYITVGALHITARPPADMHLALLRWIPTYPVFPMNDKGRKLQQIWDMEMVNLIHKGELARLYLQYGLYDFFHSFIQEMERKAEKSKGVMLTPNE